MNKIFVFLCMVLVIGILLWYFLSQNISKNDTEVIQVRSKTNTWAIQILSKIDTWAIQVMSKTDTWAIANIKLNEALRNKEISEDFFNEASDYRTSKKQFLPETLQLFKNIETYNALLSNGGKMREDGIFFDANVSVKYLLHFMDTNSLKDAGAISDMVASYENLLFLKNPSNNPQFLENRKENAQILEWKNTGKIPKSVSQDDIYLNFLFSDISREDTLTKINDFFAKKSVKEILSVHGSILWFWFDIFNADINTIISKPDIKEYLINTRIDYFYIDKSLLTGKNLCSNILNPDIKDLCEMYVSDNHKNAKYQQIIKEFFIYKLLYR